MNQRSDRAAVRWRGVADSGAVIEVVGDTEAEPYLAPRWPPMGLARSDEDAGAVARSIAITGDLDRPDILVDGEFSPGGWDRVESELALFAAEWLTGLVAVHAGVIVYADRALVLPGKSGAGKSTLCIAAIEAGASVLTDEYALVDPTTGMVIGWQRPIRVRRPNGGVERFDLTLNAGPTPIGLVALLSYEPQPTRSWSAVPGADAVLGLMANTVCARSRPDEALDAALAVSRRAKAVAGPRGEAAETVGDLLALLD